jgi:hypothetical protein
MPAVTAPAATTSGTTNNAFGAQTRPFLLKKAIQRTSLGGLVSSSKARAASACWVPSVDFLPKTCTTSMLRPGTTPDGTGIGGDLGCIMIVDFDVPSNAPAATAVPAPSNGFDSGLLLFVLQAVGHCIVEPIRAPAVSFDHYGTCDTACTSAWGAFGVERQPCRWREVVHPHPQCTPPTLVCSSFSTVKRPIVSECGFGAAGNRVLGCWRYDPLNSEHASLPGDLILMLRLLCAHQMPPSQHSFIFFIQIGH